MLMNSWFLEVLKMEMMLNFMQFWNELKQLGSYLMLKNPIFPAMNHVSWPCYRQMGYHTRPKENSSYYNNEATNIHNRTTEIYGNG